MKIIKATEKNSIELACKFLKAGKIISFATDTVYGLAVDASNNKAVENLFKIKNRDKQKPIAIFVKDLATAKKIFIFDKLSEKIANKFLPGSLTLVLKTRPQNPQKLSFHLNQNDDKFLGFRIVDNQFTKDLLQKFGGILAVTSANPSDKKPAISAQEVEKYFTNLDLYQNMNLLSDSIKDFRDKIGKKTKLYSHTAEAFSPILAQKAKLNRKQQNSLRDSCFGILIDSGKSDLAEPSTVAKIADGEITILRQGILKL